MNPDQPNNDQSNPLAANPGKPTGSNEAVELIRHKLQSIYGQEPAAKEELVQSQAGGTHRSKHQQFMYELSTSGKSLADIQTAWHNYYLQLPDQEKHQVWQEFYSAHSQAAKAPEHVLAPQPEEKHKLSKPHTRKPRRIKSITKLDSRTVADVKQQLIGRIGSRSQNQRSPHHKSLVFGLGMGLLITFIMMFGFFNERFIAPFITPSKSVSSTPIIVDSTTAVGPEPKIIIPKINVEMPVVYDEPSIEESAVQKALENGVLHYGTTPNPGEIGNAVVFGHSSNNILNRGKYKFAFVLLKRLETGDTFMLQKDGKRYIYRVFEKRVVKPDEVGVLSNISDKSATATLITCDPPGTSLNRLVVIGEQISPDPATNIASSVQQTASEPSVLPSNAPSLWHRLFSWLSS